MGGKKKCRVGKDARIEACRERQQGRKAYRREIAAPRKKLLLAEQ